MTTAWDLHRAFPEAEFVVIPDAGHSAIEAGTEAALVKALQEGRLAAAVLDVFEQEPVPPEHPFWDTPNLFMTYHTSAVSYPEDITDLFVENYRLFLDGKPLKYAVDFERGY